jgi:hypothetical protein
MMKLVGENEGPYCDPEKHGRERFSHPAMLGELGRAVLDWAWEDRACVHRSESDYSNLRSARSKWYGRLMSPDFEVAAKGWAVIDGGMYLRFEQVYLGAIQGWHNVDAPPESPTRWYVDAFASRMEVRLAAHRDRGDRPGWLAAHPANLLKAARDALDEMTHAILTRSDSEQAWKKAADAANFVMMAADSYAERRRALEVTPDQAETFGNSLK